MISGAWDATMKLKHILGIPSKAFSLFAEPRLNTRVQPHSSKSSGHIRRIHRKFTVNLSTQQSRWKAKPNIQDFPANINDITHFMSAYSNTYTYRYPHVWRTPTRWHAISGRDDTPHFIRLSVQSFNCFLEICHPYTTDNEKTEKCKKNFCTFESSRLLIGKRANVSLPHSLQSPGFRATRDVVSSYPDILVTLAWAVRLESREVYTWIWKR